MSIESNENKPNSFIRTIFVKIITVFFIFMSYIYISESFGSISSPYIGTDSFSIVFSVSLLILTFFSVLSGPLPAFFAGFLGELVYQIAFYNTIYIDWCFIIAIYGSLAGIYKYKPLKYHSIKNIFYSIVILFINSLIAIILVVTATMFFHYSSLPLSVLFSNFGLKFFFQTLLSVIISVPILLIIFDKIFASKEQHLYYMLLTHHPISASDHTFFFQFGRTKIYFCSRCSGMVIGIILSVFFTHLFQLIVNPQFSSELAFIVIIIFPIPGLIDWGTQKLLLRTSTTESRLFTGFIIGIALHFISLTREYYLLTLILITVYFSIFFLFFYFGQKRLLKKLNKELNPVSPEDFEIE
ncbi:MAG TPA: DUF2085 domain-containing protein [Candidatus Nanopelagicaceae bacterium]|nr:DUF2085 domain-containing protein [Candidatus Nanopelagicaceae bacterium]